MAAQDVMALNTHTGAGSFRATWQKNNRAYLDSTGSAVPAGMQRRQFLEALRTHTHTGLRGIVTSPRGAAGSAQRTHGEEADAGADAGRAHDRMQLTHRLRRRRVRRQQGRNRLDLVCGDHTRCENM